MSTLKITPIQTDIFWEDKAANLSALENQLNSIQDSGHIIILPEMFSTGFSMNPESLAEKMDGDTVQWMKKLAKTKKSIITGSIIVEAEEYGSEKKYVNRLIWMLPDGNYGYYDKKHLFAFAGEDNHYTSGDKRIIFSVNGWKILPQICYDLRFPVWARQQITRQENEIVPEYDLMIYVANWPEKRKYAWRSLLIARAIENQCYVIAVNRVGSDNKNNPHSGNSMLIDPLGEVLFEAEGIPHIETLAISKAHLEACRKNFPFLRDADSFKLLKDS